MRDQLEHACQSAHAAETRDDADDRIGIAPGVVALRQQERDWIIWIQAMTLQQAATPIGLHGCEAVALLVIVAKQESHPAAAQDADSIEHYDRALVIVSPHAASPGN